MVARMLQLRETDGEGTERNGAFYEAKFRENTWNIMRQLTDNKKKLMELPTTPVEQSDSGPFLLQRWLFVIYVFLLLFLLLFAANVLFLFILCDVIHSFRLMYWFYFLFISPSFVFSFARFGADFPLSWLQDYYNYNLLYLFLPLCFVCVTVICVYCLFFLISGEKGSKTVELKRKWIQQSIVQHTVRGADLIW